MTKEVDVAIVGFGPVGQALASLLGAAGHDVIVAERFESPFGLPRAIRFDGEAMRLFQRLGIADVVQEDALPAGHYLWHGADGELIVDIDTSGPHPSGWASDWVFFQPHLEAALIRSVEARPSVSVRRGWSAESIVQDQDGVTLTARRWKEGASPSSETDTIRARYVVAADGANSFVRDALGIGWDDLGFSETWMVCDVRPHDQGLLDDLPIAAQYCDPARPHVTVRNGKSHRRWEFQLLPGEDPAEVAGSEKRAWEMLAPYISPEEGELIRFATYEFRSLLAQTMQAGRVFLAGDCAHLMPPFMAEGMCSGLRDANNLSWKLDQVLRQLAPAQLLDTYTSERRAQNEFTVQISLMMGQVACILDPDAAAGRDAAFRSGQTPPPPPVPGLGDGVLHHDLRGEPAAPAGSLAVQGRVRIDGRAGLYDDVVGAGFAVVCATGDPRGVLDATQLAFLEQINASVVVLDPDVPGAAQDLDGQLSGWLREHGLAAVISRPDFYTFGGVENLEELPALVDELKTHWH
jgi:2-polyprenyl-6-methoxyphenol hydroxylase-like FAD-dependent oxidoreductase